MSDFRYVIRSMLRARWFAGGAALTFALGIGINVAVFTAVDRMLFRPLPYAHPEQLVLLRDCPPQSECSGSFPSSVALEGQGHLSTVADVAVAGFSREYRGAPNADDDPPMMLISVSPNLLPLLGVHPTVGSSISSEDQLSRRHVAWLRFESWRTKYAGDRGVVGRSLWLRNDPAEIIGVLPPGFIPPAWTSFSPLWDGLVVDYDAWSTIGPSGRVGAPVARLRAGASVAAAQAEIGGLARDGSEGLSQASQFQPLRVDPLQTALFADYRRYLMLVVFASSAIAALACANVTGLFLARGQARERQAAIRRALGASRARLFSAAVIESLLVAVAGGLLALVVLLVASRSMTAILPPLLSYDAAYLWEARTIGFLIISAFVCAVLSGSLPGWRLCSVDILPVLQRSGDVGRRSGMRSARTLLVIEGALGCVLAFGAGLAVVTLHNLVSEEIGMVPNGLYMVSLHQAPRTSSPERAATYKRAMAIASRLPGVVSVGGADSMPTSGRAAARPFSADTQGGRYQVTGDYFRALGAKLLAGRAFTEAEISSELPVAIMSRSAARLLWPDLSIGSVVGQSWHPSNENAREIVGVVEDVKNYYGDSTQRRISVYVPLSGRSGVSDVFAIRVTEGMLLDGATLRSAVRRELGPLALKVTYLPDLLDSYVRDPKFRAVLFMCLALIGMILTAVGLFAVASYDVEQRRREIGIRIMLGATGSEVAWLAIRGACGPVLLGGVLGVLSSYWLVQFAREFVYHLGVHDVWPYGSVLAILLLTTAVAAWLPARRAIRLDPVAVLRIP